MQHPDNIESNKSV